MKISFNQWFLSLVEGRQNVLKEDKWMLASNAFEAGQEHSVDNDAKIKCLKQIASIKENHTALAESNLSDALCDLLESLGYEDVVNAYINAHNSINDYSVTIIDAKPVYRPITAEMEQALNAEAIEVEKSIKKITG